MILNVRALPSLKGPRAETPPEDRLREERLPDFLVSLETERDCQEDRSKKGRETEALKKRADDTQGEEEEDESDSEWKFFRRVSWASGEGRLPERGGYGGDEGEEEEEEKQGKEAEEEEPGATGEGGAEGEDRKRLWSLEALYEGFIFLERIERFMRRVAQRERRKREKKEEQEEERQGVSSPFIQLREEDKKDSEEGKGSVMDGEQKKARVDENKEKAEEEEEEMKKKESGSCGDGVQEATGADEKTKKSVRQQERNERGTMTAAAEYGETASVRTPCDGVLSPGHAELSDEEKAEVHRQKRALTPSVLAGLLQRGLDLIVDAFRLLGPSSVILSFNGGKDAVVALHLYRAALAKFYIDLHRKNKKEKKEKKTGKEGLKQNPTGRDKVQEDQQRDDAGRDRKESKQEAEQVQKEEAKEEKNGKEEKEKNKESAVEERREEQELSSCSFPSAQVLAGGGVLDDEGFFCENCFFCHYARAKDRTCLAEDDWETPLCQISEGEGGSKSSPRDLEMRIGRKRPEESCPDRISAWRMRILELQGLFFKRDLEIQSARVEGASPPRLLTSCERQRAHLLRAPGLWRIEKDRGGEEDAMCWRTPDYYSIFRIHILYHERIPPIERPKAVFFDGGAEEFSVLVEFVHSTAKKFEFDLHVCRSELKEGIEDFLSRHESLKPLGFVLGTREGDPNAPEHHLPPLQISSPWLPPFLRVHPLAGFEYGHVWRFIKLFRLPYCSLYDLGYTSIGKTDDTQPNPYLYSSTEERYKPATCLRLWKHEREGRVRINGTLPSATGGAKEGEKKQSAQEEEKKFPFSSSFLQQQQEVRGNCACVLSSETSLVLPSAPLSSSSPPPPLALP